MEPNKDVFQYTYSAKQQEEIEEPRTSLRTIRRALRLLADMKVVEVKPQSGAVVLSADRNAADHNFSCEFPLHFYRTSFQISLNVINAMKPSSRIMPAAWI